MIKRHQAGSQTGARHGGVQRQAPPTRDSYPKPQIFINSVQNAEKRAIRSSNGAKTRPATHVNNSTAPNACFCPINTVVPGDNSSSRCQSICRRNFQSEGESGRPFVAYRVSQATLWEGGKRLLSPNEGQSRNKADFLHYCSATRIKASS